jgi:Protein of unknown function (DUF1552)
MEHNPRVVFERLFGDGGSTEEARLARIRKDRSLLDSVTDKANSLGKRIGASDRAKLTEYLEAVRDIERRIQRAEEQNSTVPVVDQPTGIPAAFADHVKLMFDLQVLAFTSDTTRVFSFKFGRDASGRVYPGSGVDTGFHNASHHGTAQERIRQFSLINKYHVSMLPYFMEKLQAAMDGDTNLLEKTLIVYGSPMANGNNHNHRNCPLILLGHGNGALQGDLHVKAADGTPMANVMLTLMHKLGLNDIQTFGDSTGAFSFSA